MLPQPAAGFPKAAPHPQQAGPAQEAPPRPRPAPVQTGLHSPMIPGPVPPPFVHQHGHSAACPCLSLLPGPAGTHGLGRGLLHALWSRASTAPTPVAAHGTAVSACQSRRSLTDLTDLCLFTAQAQQQQQQQQQQRQGRPEQLQLVGGTASSICLEAFAQQAAAVGLKQQARGQCISSGGGGHYHTSWS